MPVRAVDHERRLDVVDVRELSGHLPTEIAGARLGHVHRQFRAVLDSAGDGREHGRGVVVGQNRVDVREQRRGAVGGAALARFDRLDHIVDGVTRDLLGVGDAVDVRFGDRVDDVALGGVQRGVGGVGPTERVAVAFERAAVLLDRGKLLVSELTQGLSGLDGDDGGTVCLHIGNLRGSLVDHTGNVAPPEQMAFPMPNELYPVAW